MSLQSHSGDRTQVPVTEIRKWFVGLRFRDFGEINLSQCDIMETCVCADDKEYDVYISYARNSEEEQFVLSTLRRVLENELGYSVCIFDRDSLPGGSEYSHVHSDTAVHTLKLLQTATSTAILVLLLGVLLVVFLLLLLLFLLILLILILLQLLKLLPLFLLVLFLLPATS